MTKLEQEGVNQPVPQGSGMTEKELLERMVELLALLEDDVDSIRARVGWILVGLVVLLLLLLLL